MTSNGGRDEGFQQKSHVKDVNVVVGNKPGSQVYDELEVSKVDENVTGGRDLVVVGHHQNIVSQGSLVHWERFLHVDSIKVMLVENDDCTRHIVTALLRNCNYQVIEASNGFQAWKILENLSNHIDIVLTEVVMPSYSGVGLLCKIMSHKTRKNIPVIMMSSNDSMGLVFKCLTKGAVDFLLKPIRKNELKNLWQHVWRRCHSSSGSGSESGTNGQKSVNSKRSESDDSISIVGDDDDGCGTQSSWTKQAVEVESPQAVSPCDSTCGLVIHSDEIPATIDLQGQDGKFSEYVTTKGIELKTEGSKNSKKIGEIEVVKEPKNILETNTKVMDDSRGTLTELSLKRPREVNQGQNGHNVLGGHSEPSAFTSYNTISKQVVPGKSDDIPEADLVGPPQVHHIHHHHHVHHYHNMGSNQPPDSHKDSGLTKGPHCGSSNVLGGGGAEGKIGNCSLNGSGSGSKHGSNVAALMKFPEKRKGRRLQKKVRYQNRKQNVGESSSNGEDG